jgi:two-component system cell cycle response regulator
MAGKKILIVDDDLDMRRALRIRLNANNYQTVFASDGISAVSMARKEQPDLILLDLGLPGGDGFAVIERLRTLTSVAPVPIIVITGKEPSESMGRAIEAGAQAYFQKPVDNKQLLAAIRNALGEGVDTARDEGQLTEGRPPRPGKKILVVDDDKDLLRGLAIRLKASGYSIVVAADATFAIMTARKEHPDLILLDLGLPGGDGFKVMERLRSIDELTGIPVIILTGKDASEVVDKAREAGAWAYFQKPADNEKLLAVIRRALGESAGPSRREA